MRLIGTPLPHVDHGGDNGSGIHFRAVLGEACILGDIVKLCGLHLHRSDSEDVVDASTAWDKQLLLGRLMGVSLIVTHSRRLL
jgi:hypothetical protein